MTLQNRELQIRLTEIQVDYEDLVARLATAFAIEFGTLVLLVSVLYTSSTSNFVLFLLSPTLNSNLLLLLQVSTIILMVIVVCAVMPWSYGRYRSKRKELKDRLKKLRREYLW